MARLTEQLKAKAEGHERVVQLLRREHEAAKAAYEARLAARDGDKENAEGAGGNSPTPGTPGGHAGTHPGSATPKPAAAATRARELERQLEELRGFYGRKLRGAREEAEAAEKGREKAEAEAAALRQKLGGPGAAAALLKREVRSLSSLCCALAWARAGGVAHAAAPRVPRARRSGCGRGRRRLGARDRKSVV